MTHRTAILTAALALAGGLSFLYSDAQTIATPTPTPSFSGMQHVGAAAQPPGAMPKK